MPSASHSRQISFPPSLFASLLAAAGANRAPAEATELLRQAGFDAGGDLLALLEARSGARGSDSSIDSLPDAQFWGGFISLWESLGWGTLVHRQVHPGVAELVSLDWAEADASPGGLGCQVTTGLFADLLSRVAGGDVAVLEVECRGRGDEQCRFVVGSVAALEALHGSLADGESTDDWLARSADPAGY